MSFNNKNLLLASILGSKAAERVPRFEILQNELAKHNLPPIPFLPLKVDVKVEEIQTDEWDANYNILPTSTPEKEQFFPMKIKKVNEPDTAWWLFPFEPMVSITGENNIKKRDVSKHKNLIGSIKERIHRNDYEITITGILFGDERSTEKDEIFPERAFTDLKKYLTCPEGLQIICYPLNQLDITMIVVESFTFPFTKGENVQAFEIKVLSDDKYDLNVKKTDI